VPCIRVVPYDPDWPRAFEMEKERITEALGSSCIAIHHIGSTAVPGLAAKPKIDIIAAARGREAVVASLGQVGYAHRGEWNIPLQCGFTKRGVRDVNLHLFPDGNHPEIELNLKFRDYLRTHSDVRREYAALKMAILEDETSQRRTGKLSFPVYTLRKGDFIRKVLARAAYGRLRVLKCSSDGEWAAAKDLRQRCLFDGAKVWDPFHWTFDHPEHEHFVLYRGVEIVAYAHVQLLTRANALLRAMAIAEENRGQGFATQLLSTIEEWLQFHGYGTLHIESPGRSSDFYKKRGYIGMPPDMTHFRPNAVALGKRLAEWDR
jgi:GrpB-like predicted nucleotidyltransferase (UPF0157 family)/GNAT superfamily N-acetyltransferase